MVNISSPSASEANISSPPASEASDDEDVDDTQSESGDMPSNTRAVVA
eukprot:CAMPEP_0178419296 /NCGR_PEP_ID=MMETSP0689_2-20121128/25536_1 /TAXON_ID=160604 /ORGANISM="Amphidinium massartii, Strain CS-259" /LENGTH=47 /DNA_ID= /DNA_START= /DNA_END= /DNA_ORIENTATION=